jgi:hypothetical protein
VIAIILGSFLGGVIIALLVAYFRVGLKKGALRIGSAIRVGSVGVWEALRGGRRGAIRLPTSAKGEVERELEQE